MHLRSTEERCKMLYTIGGAILHLLLVVAIVVFLAGLLSGRVA